MDLPGDAESFFECLREGRRWGVCWDGTDDAGNARGDTGFIIFGSVL